MAPYVPTTWERRVVQYPERYHLTDLGGDYWTISPAHGNVIEAGTELSEGNLNNLETQYDEANDYTDSEITTHAAETTGVHGAGGDTLATDDDISTAIDDLNLSKGAKAGRDSNQTISNDTATALIWNVEEYDTDSMHDVSTNNSRMTCNTAGKYLITASISWGSNDEGLRDVSILKNNTTYISFVRSGRDGETRYPDERQNVNVIADLAVNDYVEIIVSQTSGGDLIAGHLYNFFAIQRLGD